MCKYGGLGDRHQQNGVNYTLDLNAGLTQVLADGTNTYLYGNGRILQHATQTEYFLGDALGSVRQLTNTVGAVTLTQSYAPYGDVVQTVGTAQTNYAFTGEARDVNGLTYLRARYYNAGDGRFISRDTWDGESERPKTLNRWQYGYSNPILYTDPSGYVACSLINFPDLRSFCYTSTNGNDDDPNVLDARQKFFSRFAFYSRSYGRATIGGEGYIWAGKMLQTFVDGNVQQLNVNLPANTSFGRDAGIVRVTKIKSGAKYPSDEPLEITPLLYRFINDHLQPTLSSCSPYFSLIDDFSVGSQWNRQGSSPRPHDRGWWGAFGHVKIGATYSNSSYVKVPNGYLIQTQATYRINDNYGWFEGKSTPFGPPVASKTIWIPHEWELSLVRHRGAVMFDFSVSWRERFSIFVSKDFSQFGIGSENNIPLNN